MLYIAYACLCQGPWSDADAAVGASFSKAKDSVPSALSNRTLAFQLLKRIKDYTVKETQRFLRAEQMKANSSKDRQYKEFLFFSLLVTVAPVNLLVKKLISSSMQLMVLCLACLCTAL